MADASLWINIATLLAVFDITKPLDVEGRRIEPDLECVSSTTVRYVLECSLASISESTLYHVSSYPKLFRSHFSVRSVQKLELLQSTRSISI